MDSVNTCPVAVNHIMESAGYRIRGWRADCPHCKGHSRLTVSFTDDGRFYCHRCLKGGHVRQLARDCGLTLHLPRVRKADIPKRQFREWLSRKYSEMARVECRLRHRAELARVALQFFPDFEPAWQALADFYHAERRLAEFFEAASDKIGRFQLYREWRRRTSVHEIS